MVAAVTYEEMEAAAYVVLGAMALVATALWLARASARRCREDRLRDWAKSQNLTYRCGRCPEMDKQYAWIPCLQQGDARYAYNLISGVWGNHYCFLGFDCDYVIRATEAGERDKIYSFSAVILGVPCDLKPLDVRRKRLWEAPAGLLESFNVQFENARFTRRFHVDCYSDYEWAHDVLSPNTIERLLEAPKFTIQMRGPVIAVYRSKQFALRDFEDAANLAVRIVERLPKGVVKECSLPELVPADVA